ncbi:MAG: CAP domain-containing protein, partial [Gemmatimonadetes bacterium]|nr:CAP domain-containing protein [Gemmatimonadota bacterium]
RRPEMRHLISPVTVVVVLVITLGCSDDGPAGPGSSDVPAGEVTIFVTQLNSHRESVGCEALAWHPATAEVGHIHSQDMQDRGFFSHTNPDGESPWDRLAEGGVTWNGPAGENIAMTSGGAESVLEMWLNSPGHRANIENCAFSHHGVGLSGSYWTHVFITNPD